jgi:hypothetical protein
MRDLWSRGATASRRCHTPVGGIRMLLIAIGAVGVSSPADATALTESGAYLRYANQSPSILFGPGDERIDFGATNVMPSSLAGTTGIATTTNLRTGALISFPIPGTPSPVDLNNWREFSHLCDQLYIE